MGRCASEVYTGTGTEKTLTTPLLQVEQKANERWRVRRRVGRREEVRGRSAYYCRSCKPNWIAYPGRS